MGVDRHRSRPRSAVTSKLVVKKVEDGQAPAPPADKDVCQHCGLSIVVRNPSGYCDHLFYPESCPTCIELDRLP